MVEDKIAEAILDGKIKGKATITVEDGKIKVS